MATATFMYQDLNGQYREIPVNNVHIEGLRYGSGSPLCVQTSPVLDSSCPVGPVVYSGEPLPEAPLDPDLCHYCGSWHSLTDYGRCVKCGGPARVKPRRPNPVMPDRDAFVPNPPMEWHMMPSSSCNAPIRYAVSRNNTHGW